MRTMRRFFLAAAVCALVTVPTSRTADANPLVVIYGGYLIGMTAALGYAVYKLHQR